MNFTPLGCIEMIVGRIDSWVSEKLRGQHMLPAVILAPQVAVTEGECWEVARKGHRVSRGLSPIQLILIF